MGLVPEPQEVRKDSKGRVTEDVKYLLKESAIRFLSEVKVQPIRNVRTRSRSFAK